MDRWKKQGKEKGKEEKRRDKMQVREKVGKSRFAVFFANGLWLWRVEK